MTEPEAQRLLQARAVVAGGARHAFVLAGGPGAPTGPDLGAVAVVDHDAALAEVAPSHHAVAVEATARARAWGTARQEVALVSGDRAVLHVFDLRRTHGVVVGVMTPGPRGAPAGGPPGPAQRLLERLAESLPDGVLQLDGRRAVVFANQRAQDLLGDDAGLAALLDLSVPEDRPLLAAALDAGLGQGRDRTVEVRVRRPGRAEAVYEVTVRPVLDAPAPAGSPAVAGALCGIADITERARRHRELEARATFDPLTATFTRGATLEALAEAVDTAGPGAGVAVVFVDLDGFAQVNTTFGRTVGDELLRVVAHRLREAVRTGDVVGRLDADEFVVVCRDLSDTQRVGELAARIARSLAEPTLLVDTVLVPSASVGSAWTFDRATGAEALLAAADASMGAARSDRSP